MCILCQGPPDQFDIEHMRASLKKLSAQEKKDKAIDIKVALQLAEKNRVDGDQWAIAHLKEAQYLLCQYL